jgi:hypothetical protein
MVGRGGGGGEATLAVMKFRLGVSRQKYSCLRHMKFARNLTNSRKGGKMLIVNKRKFSFNSKTFFPAIRRRRGVRQDANSTLV